MRLRYRFVVALVAAFLGAGSFGVSAHASTMGKGGNGNGGTHNSSTHSSQSNGGSKWNGNWERHQGEGDHFRDHDRFRDNHCCDNHRDHCCDHFNDHCCDNGGDENSDCDWLRNHDHDRWWRDCSH